MEVVQPPKSCPFCASTPTLTLRDENGVTATVHCYECDAAIERINDPEGHAVVAAWNTRALDYRVRRTLERMRDGTRAPSEAPEAPEPAPAPTSPASGPSAPAESRSSVLRQSLAMAAERLFGADSQSARATVARGECPLHAEPLRVGELKCNSCFVD